MEITAITRNHMYGELHNPFCNLQKLRAWKIDDNKCKHARSFTLFSRCELYMAFEKSVKC